MHVILFCSITYYNRPRYFTLGTSWIYRPRLSSPIFEVALQIILAHTRPNLPVNRPKKGLIGGHCTDTRYIDKNRRERLHQMLQARGF